jgi:hypothetical protein
MRRQLEAWEVDERIPPADSNMSSGAEERQPLEDVTKAVTAITSLCVVVMCKVEVDFTIDGQLASSS